MEKITSQEKKTEKTKMSQKLQLLKISEEAKERKSVKKFNSEKKPFNMIIVGMTCCGKTHCLLNFLEREYKNYFDHIFLICPTFQWNKTYENWKYDEDEDFIAIPCDQDEVEKYLKIVVDFSKGSKLLIILDDVASGKDVKNRCSELVKLGFSARHYNLSVVVITQQLTSIAKPFRENVSKLVTFYNPNKKDMKTILEEYSGVNNRNELQKIMKTLKNKRYSNLEISLIFPYGYIINE